MTRKSFGRRFWITVLAGGGTLLLGGLSFSLLAAFKLPPTERPPSVKVYQVEAFETERRTLAETLYGYGTAKADREVLLSAQVAGEIVERHPRFYVGNRVRPEQILRDDQGKSLRDAGDVLLRIDPEVHRQRLLQAESRLHEFDAQLKLLEQQEANNLLHQEKARHDLKLAEEQSARMEALRKQKVASESEVTASRLEVQRYKEGLLTLENEKKLFPIRRQQLERLRATQQAECELARIELQRTEIRPPFAGVISEALVELGQQVRPGDPLVRLIDLSVVEVAVSLGLSDYARIADNVVAGEQPRVLLAEHELAPPRWSGYVVRVAPQADPLTRMVKVFVRVDNSQQKTPLLPGTFVQARIEGPELPGVLPIPRDAVVNGRVFIIEGEKTKSVPIRSTRSWRGMPLVDHGLQPGQQVVLTNLDVLRDGAHVHAQQFRTWDQELQSLDPSSEPRTAIPMVRPQPSPP